MGGLVPPSLPTHHHIPPNPFSELELNIFSGHERFEPTIGLGGLATSLRSTSTISLPPLSEFVICFLGLLNLPSLVRMGPFNPEIGPFHSLFAALIERCQHPIPGTVLGGPVPLPFDPPSPSAPIHRRRANRAPFLSGIDLGGLNPPPSCPMHHHVSLEILSATHRCGPYQKSDDPFFAPKPSAGLFRPMTSPPVREPAPRKAPRTLALLLDRLSGHPSFSPAPTLGASV